MSARSSNVTLSDTRIIRLEQINEALGMPLVIHGGTGLSNDQFRRLIANGVSKINYYTALADAAGKQIRVNAEQKGGFTGLEKALERLSARKWNAAYASGEAPTAPRRYSPIAGPGHRSSTERWLFETVEFQARSAGIGMPEVALWDSPKVNAFATGMSKNKALVAVSTGLLHQKSREEAEGVLGHEVAQVANGDMVTLALIQGVVNTFVLFLSRVIGRTVDRVIFKSEDGHGPAFWVKVIVIWFSRQREFRADTGGAQLTSQHAMIATLEQMREEPAKPLATHRPSP